MSKLIHVYLQHLRRLTPSFALMALVSGGFLSRAATPGVPERMAYQGYLTDSNGLPLGDTQPAAYTIQFKLFSEQSGGQVIWDEQQTVTVDNGYFSVLLGEGLEVSPGKHGPLSSAFLGSTTSDRYIEMTVLGIGDGGGDVTILPRLRLLSSAYAFLAGKAQGLVDEQGSSLIADTGSGGIAITGDVSVTGSFTGSVDGSNITENLNGSALVDRSVPDSKLSSNVPLLDNDTNAFTGAITTGGAINGATWGKISSNLKIGRAGSNILWEGFGIRLVHMTTYTANSNPDLSTYNEELYFDAPSSSAYSVTCFIEGFDRNGQPFISTRLSDFQGIDNNRGKRSFSQRTVTESTTGSNGMAFCRISIHTNVAGRAEIVIARGVNDYFNGLEWRGSWQLFR
ncbi:MAG: hypothetical protein ACO34E_02765 [Limisphaerales bacterium]